MNEWLRVLRAADAAARWHVHQRRKGPAEEPYINHLVEVAMLVADATDGTDTNLARIMQRFELRAACGAVFG
jgi:(p)ppGpp synthase/HD superfamily hydrolase